MRTSKLHLLPTITMSADTPAAGKVSNSTVEPHLRKKKLVRKNKDHSKIKYQVWLAGHCMCLVFGTVTFVWQTLWLRNAYYINSIAYRLALLGAFLALGSTTAHKYGLQYLPPLTTFLSQQNFQFLILSMVWCFTFKSVLKIIPFFLISLLQVAENKKIAVVQKQADFLAQLIVYDELLLIVYLLLRTIFFRNTSGFQLVLKLVFLWLRILFDPTTSDMFLFVVQKLDGKVSTVKNEKVQMVWKKVKLALEEKRHDN